LISTFGDEDDGWEEVDVEEEDVWEEVDVEEEEDGWEEVDVEEKDDCEEVDVEEEEDGWEEEEASFKLAEAVIMAKATRRTKGRQASMRFPHVTSCI
jgi:hypothetical protein